MREQGVLPGRLMGTENLILSHQIDMHHIEDGIPGIGFDGSAVQASTTHRLQMAVSRLAHATAAEAILLFGSRARGDSHSDSDWDLCVIVSDDVGHGRFTERNLAPLISDLGLPIQIFPIRRKVFESKLSDVNSLSHDVARDGILLAGQFSVGGR